MSRRKKEQQQVAEENVQAKTPEAENDRFITDEKLQAYYNDAYIGERDRLNSMFGRIDTYPVVEEKIIYRDPDLTEYVPIKKYKKKSCAAAVLGILFGIAAIACAVLAYLHFAS